MSEPSSSVGARQEPSWSMVVAIVALCGAIVAGGLSLVAAARDTGVASSSAGSSVAVTQAKIELADVSVVPRSINVAKGKKITFEVVNKGVLDHDLVLADRSGTKMLGGGKKQTIELGPFDTSTKMWCSVPGHKEAGMVLDVVVGDRAVAAASAANGANPDDATIDFAKTPAPNWKPFDPRLVAAPGATEHKLILHAR